MIQNCIRMCSFQLGESEKKKLADLSTPAALIARSPQDAQRLRQQKVEEAKLFRL